MSSNQNSKIQNVDKKSFNKEQTFKKWKSLVNMTRSELKEFYDSDEGKEAGLSSSEAKSLKIHSGRESARWIMKMLPINHNDWTPTMWEWANRQISFISRMRGNKGGLYDDKGNKTPKHTSLLIWGHNPEKHKAGGSLSENTYNFWTRDKLKDFFDKINQDELSFDYYSNFIDNNFYLNGTSSGDIGTITFGVEEGILYLGLNSEEHLKIVDEKISDVIYKENEYTHCVCLSSGDDNRNFYIIKVFDCNDFKKEDIETKSTRWNNEYYEDIFYMPSFVYLEFPYTEKHKAGGSISKTPAPKSDRIYGSKVNEEESSKDLASSKEINFDESTLSSIKSKVQEHNKKYPSKKITLEAAKAVVRRGMGAYSVTHRPTIKCGKPNSRVAWGLARLNAFLYKAVNGNSKSGKYSQDNDLMDELHIPHKKFEGGIVDDFIVGDYTNVGIVEDVTPTQVKCNGDWYAKSIVHKISMQGIDKPKFVYESVVAKLKKEHGDGFIKLYHGTDKNSYDEIMSSKTIGDGRGVSFFTNSLKEARQYAENKAAYRGVSEGKVLQVSVPKWAVVKNKATGEYETQFTLKENDGGVFTPTMRSVYDVYNNMYNNGGEVPLLAPNGKESNLTPEQWHLVRSEKFKAWFGDFEKYGYYDKLLNSDCVFNVEKKYPYDYFSMSHKERNKHYTDIIKQSKEKANNATTKDGFTISITNSGLLHGIRHSMMEVVLNSCFFLEEIIENSILFDMENNADEEDTSTIGFYCFLSIVKYLGKDYLFRVTAALRADKRIELYDYNVVEIKMHLANTLNPQQGNTNHQVQHKDRKFFELINTLEKNISKVLDKNGEPLICYRGIVKNKKDVDVNNPYYIKGMWFTSASSDENNYEEGNAESVARGFSDIGEIESVFLNIKNPKIYDDYEDILDEIDKKGGVDNFYKSFVKRDGLKLEGSMTDGDVFRDDWVVFNISQIKNAEGINPDVRYERGGNFSGNAKNRNTEPIQFESGGYIPKLLKVKSFKTNEGSFDIYDTDKGGARGRGDMFTILKDKNGWIVRNAFVPDNLQKKGIATYFYKKMNDESLKATGKPLRSTQQRTLNNGEEVHELTQNAIKLWDSLVRDGFAEKLGEKNYRFLKEQSRAGNLKEGGFVNDTMNLWHGGNLEEYNDVIAQKNGRYEYGAGLYLTDHKETAIKYAKGSRKLYLITIKKGVDINDAFLDIETVNSFISKYVIGNKRKEVKERIGKYVKNGKVKAFLLNNIILNEKAISSTNTNKLRSFYVENGIDYEVVDNAFGWGETMVVLYNMDKIVKKEKQDKKYEEGGSVDNDGRYIAYYGSPVYKEKGELLPATGGELGAGLYFTRNYKLAENYAQPRGEVFNMAEAKLKSGVSELDLSGLKIKSITKDEYINKRSDFYDAEQNLNNGDWSLEIAHSAELKLIDYYESNGYDGLEVESEEQGVIFPYSVRKIKHKLVEANSNHEMRHGGTVDYNFSDDLNDSIDVDTLERNGFGDILYNPHPDKKRINDLNAYFKKNSNKLFVLYHGTDRSIPILEEGLKKTSEKRRRSYQSESGYVYLTPFKDTARTFGEMGNPYGAKVYKVKMPVRFLLPDKDQLGNKREVSDFTIGDTLAESVILGGSVRVNGNIPVYMIEETNYEKGGLLDTDTSKKFTLLHNTDKAPYMGSLYGQDVEPTGFFAVIKNNNTFDSLPNYDTYVFYSQKQLYIPIESDNYISWKNELSKKYKAKKSALTKKLVAEGYDILITVYDNGDTGEVIVLNDKYLVKLPKGETMKSGGEVSIVLFRGEGKQSGYTSATDLFGKGLYLTDDIDVAMHYGDNIKDYTVKGKIFDTTKNFDSKELRKFLASLDEVLHTNIGSKYLQEIIDYNDGRLPKDTDVDYIGVSWALNSKEEFMKLLDSKKMLTNNFNSYADVCTAMNLALIKMGYVGLKYSSNEVDDLSDNNINDRNLYLIFDDNAIQKYSEGGITEKDLYCCECGEMFKLSKNDNYICPNCNYDNETAYIMSVLKPTKTLEELSSIHNVPLEQLQLQFQKGIATEMEHTTDKRIAQVIALHHIEEMPDYYDKLSLMEAKQYKNGGVADCGCGSNMKYDEGGVLIVESNGNCLAEKFLIKNTGQVIELEGGEGIMCPNSMQSDRNFTFEGNRMTGRQVASHLNNKYGGIEFAHGGEVGHVLGCIKFNEGGELPTYTLDELKGGEGVVCVRAMDSNDKYSFNGSFYTPKQILAQINLANGGKKFEEGGVIDLKKYKLQMSDKLAKMVYFEEKLLHLE